MAVVAVKEEAAPEVEELADSCEWVSLGQLSKLIDTFRAEGVSQAVMSGRIQHKQIFSAIRPDWRLLKVLNSLRRKNTDSLLGALAQVLESEGISLLDSTHFLTSSLADAGPNGRRKPSRGELNDIAYGREVAQALAGFDIGQSVVVCARFARCVLQTRQPSRWTPERHCFSKRPSYWPMRTKRESRCTGRHRLHDTGTQPVPSAALSLPRGSRQSLARRFGPRRTALG